MGNKVSPIIIGVIVVVVIAVIVLIASVFMKGGSSNGVGPTINPSSIALEPVLTLSKDSDEKNSNKVVITAYATTDDEDGIDYIELPNGDKVYADTANYIVDKNGLYKFKVFGKNGASAETKMRVNEIAEISAINPYVPEGFSVVEDKVEDGYVIEDEYGNQYVWVPVENGILKRKTLLNADYSESTSTTSELVNSAAKYYGFYVARYEASGVELDNNVVCTSMEGRIPWTNIKYTDAANYSNNAASIYGYEDVSTALMNSYAWDTIMDWVDQKYENYSSNTNYGNYSNTIYPTGATTSDMVNNIADLAGNVREWTTEIYKGSMPETNDRNNKETTIYRVIRGGSANLSRTPASHIPYSENTSDNYWGFRMILYKQA